MNFTQQIVNALSLGAIYSLIALGYTMVFGILNLINLAHGAVMMVGAYMGFICVNYLHTSIPIAVLFACIVCGLFGIVLEKFAYRPLLKGKPTGLVVAAVGASITIEYVMMLLFDSKPRAYNINYAKDILTFGEVAVSKMKLTILVMSVVIMLILAWFLKYTATGRAMRAVSDKELAASLCGVNKQQTITCAFVIGCALAAVAGVIYGSMYLIHPLMGGGPGLKAFCAAVLGGVGNIFGAVAGGLLLGFIETFVTVLLNSAVKDMVTYIIMILVLLFLPGGLTGTMKGDNRV